MRRKHRRAAARPAFGVRGQAVHERKKNLGRPSEGPRRPPEAPVAAPGSREAAPLVVDDAKRIDPASSGHGHLSAPAVPAEPRGLPARRRAPAHLRGPVSEEFGEGAEKAIQRRRGNRHSSEVFSFFLSSFYHLFFFSSHHPRRNPRPPSSTIKKQTDTASSSPRSCPATRTSTRGWSRMTSPGSALGLSGSGKERESFLVLTFFVSWEREKKETFFLQKLTLSSKTFLHHF